MRNIRLFVLAVGLLLCSFTAFTQSNENFEKAKNYLELKGEVYFKFSNPGVQSIMSLTKFISIDNVTNEFVYAYANSKEFEKFLSFEFSYEVLQHPGELLKNTKMFDTDDKATMAWDAYPTYDAYVAMMYQFQTDYPNLCRVVDAGTTVNGRKLLFAVISDNVATHEQEPRFMYTSTMHGDETTGYIMMLRLIDYLLSNYGTNTEATDLVNNLEIWINPLENPDGCYKSGNNTVNGAVRYNGNNEDLNRNYKNPVDGDHPDGAAWQPEVLAMVGLTDTMHFVMSANNHGGIELVNYPWDSWTSSQNVNADQAWWIQISSAFRDVVHANAPNGYFTGMNNGITHGGDWYVVTGSRQDYMDYYHHGREFTLEISNVKLLDPANLPAHWDYLYQSYLNYMKETLYGFNGIVTDSLTGEPLYANVFINGRDIDNTDVYTELPIGDYYRPIEAGTYSVTYSSNGYIPKTLSITVGTNQTVIKDVQLARTTLPPVAGFTVTKTNYCSAPATVQFTNTTTDAYSYLWDFGDGTTSTEFSPSHIYNYTGTYTVSLTATGYGGSNSYEVIDYIFIDASNPCDFTMGISGIGTSTECHGILFDSGFDSNYQNNTSSIFTISPIGASSITLTFSEFSFENNYDYLYIYDGSNTTSPLIGQFTGLALPNGGTITTTSGSVTFKQTSDQGVTASGFVLNWDCNYPSSTPAPDFTSNKSQTCDGIIEFTDLSTQGPVSWFWDFGDGTTSVEQNPLHIYTQNGIFNVKLVVTNSFGSDSITKSGFINVDMPVAPSTTSDLRCGEGMLNLTATGAGTLNWYLDEVSDSVINTGTIYQTPVLTSSTDYYVSSLVYNPIQNVGSVDYNANGGWHNSGTYYNMFDVYNQLEIVSVFVKKQTAGNVTISLLSSTGTVLQTATASAPAGTSRINLNFNVAPGTNYGLKVTNATSLWRNNNGVTMPYEIPGLISITTTNAGSNLYYYLYDWEVREAACESPRTIVSALINDIPMLDLGNDESTCEGTTAQIIAPPGFSYLWSTGSTSQSIVVTTSGDYSLTITDANLCSNSDTINVTFNALPVVSLGNDTAICDGSNLLLDAGSWVTYLWSNSSTTQTIQANVQGLYSVTVTDINDCFNSDDINISINSLPVVNLGNDTIICEGTDVVLDAGAGFSYLWSNTEVTQTISVNSPDIYEVTVTDINNCSATDQITILMDSLPVADFSYVVNNGNVVFTNLSDLSDTYSWDFGNGSNSSLINPAVTYTSSNLYLVSLTASNSCGWDSIQKNINVIISGIYDLSSRNFTVYPNPASDKLNIELNDSFKVNSIVISDITGKVILNKLYDDNFKLLTLDLSNIKSGIYIVELNLEIENIVFRLIID